MKYLYYPGCSLEGTAREYDLATRTLMAATGSELQEIDDWSCCGASAAESVSHLLSFALPARNLALAEQMETHEDIVVPCSACYLNLKKVTEQTKTDPALMSRINTVLEEDNLQLEGRIRVRHLLDVLSNDLGCDALEALVKNPLTDLSIAPYYGCQCLRPYPVFDNPETPTSMEPLIRATGAAITPWDMGAKCCGASHMSTKPEVGLKLVSNILKAAKGAHAIVTVCPMCQMNLEAYQKKISRSAGEDLSITILYLPQFIGLALGIPPKALGIDMNLALTSEFKKRIGTL
jgi:heterodisulfide reductase subunit B2